MSRLTYKSNYKGLTERLTHMATAIPVKGKRWAQEAAEAMQQECIANLANQHREQPLSAATEELYRNAGYSNSSASLSSQIHLSTAGDRHRFVATVGIPEGQPTIVARVQDRGAVIPVTDKMRGFLSVHGLHLRADTTHIVIPGRHFWRNALRTARRKAKDKLKKIAK